MHLHLHTVRVIADQRLSALRLAAEQSRPVAAATHQPPPALGPAPASSRLPGVGRRALRALIPHTHLRKEQHPMHNVHPAETTSPSAHLDRGLVRQRYTVTGMTCDHCRRAITTELHAVAGVDEVAIDLPGSVTVDSVHPLPLEAVAAAIYDAGYDLVP